MKADTDAVKAARRLLDLANRMKHTLEQCHDRGTARALWYTLLKELDGATRTLGGDDRDKFIIAKARFRSITDPLTLDKTVIVAPVFWQGFIDGATDATMRYRSATPYEAGYRSGSFKKS